MTVFSTTLKNLRIESNFDSARGFYNHVHSKGERAFNYPYYVRLEKGEAQPSSKVVRALVKHFSKKDQESLLSAWCQMKFPEHDYLFGTDSVKIRKAKQSKRKEETTPANELSPREISILAEAKTNYMIFLLVTLSRYEIAIKTLEKFFEKKELRKSLLKLEENNLIHLENEVVSVNIVERIFPAPQSKEIRRVYTLFDLWDNEISELFKFKEITQRKFIRRISYRYISLIENHLGLMFELIRTADEIEPEHNNSVIQFHLRFFGGKLPG